MNREQMLLNILSEECAEVAQRASKAIRFGMEEKQPGQHSTNRDRLEMELGDLMGMVDMLGLIPDHATRTLKPKKVERYLNLSIKQGCMEAPSE